MQTTIDVFKYENYRDFLNDYYNEQKTKNPQKFSHRYFARLAGFATSNFLQLVIKGKRNLSHDSIRSISTVLKLTGRRFDYFENLVYFNQASDQNQKTQFFDRLVSFKEYQEARLLNDSHKLYFSRWYFPVVREMVRLPAFKPDPEWIATHIQPPIKPDQAKEALHILKRLNLVEVNKQGKWQQKNVQLRTSSQGVAHEVAAYHRKMIELGYDCLSRPALERDVSAMTMCISQTKFAMIQKRIVAFREDIEALIQQALTDSPRQGQGIDENIPSQICQLNMQFFRLAK